MRAATGATAWRSTLALMVDMNRYTLVRWEAKIDAALQISTKTWYQLRESEVRQPVPSNQDNLFNYCNITVKTDATHAKVVHERKCQTTYMQEPLMRCTNRMLIQQLIKIPLSKSGIQPVAIQISSLWKVEMQHPFML